MPLGIPMNRQRGGAWANVGGPGFVRDQMAMGQQEVGWAQQMDMFYAGLERAETQFEETLAERTRQYDLGFGERQRTFDVGQENWLKQFGFAEEQWREQKETMDIEQAQRTFDLEQSRVRVRARRAVTATARRETQVGAPPQDEYARVSKIQALRRLLKGSGGGGSVRRSGGDYARVSKIQELRGLLEGTGGRSVRRSGESTLSSRGKEGRVAQATQSLSEKWAQDDALSELKGFIRMQKEAAEERSRSRYPTFYGPTTPDPSYNAPWEGYLSPTEQGIAPDYGFGANWWEEEEEEEFDVGPEFALY